MYHFRSNPSSRRVAPTPAYVRSYFPLHSTGDTRLPQLSHPRSDRNADLISRIVAFCDRHGMAGATFGRRFAGDSRLIPSLSAGRKLGPDLSARIDAVLTGGQRHA